MLLTLVGIFQLVMVNILVSVTTDGISRTINVASTSAVIDCNTTSAIDISVAYTAKKVANWFC